jgi:hypothetical protein
MDNQSLKPVVLDLGKKSKKAIKRLKRGEGELVEKAAVAANGAATAAGKDASKTITLILLYEKKAKKSAKVGITSLFKV